MLEFESSKLFEQAVVNFEVVEANPTYSATNACESLARVQLQDMQMYQSSFRGRREDIRYTTFAANKRQLDLCIS